MIICNIVNVFQFLPLSLSNDEEIVTGLAFPLGPPTTIEPPKEKPPPPPVDDISDEEAPPVEPLKRLNSTRRIKKELRTRRSDFLGIEGVCSDFSISSIQRVIKICTRTFENYPFIFIIYDW